MSDETAAPESGEAINPFRIRAFALFWGARFLFTLGSQSQAVAIGWQVYEVARRDNSVAEAALYVGLIGLAQFVPMFLLALPAGEMADRRDRRAIALVCVAAESACALAFLALALAGHPPFWALFLIAMGFGAARAVIAPASQALGPMLVPRASLPKAIALNSLAFQVAAVAGPALGGVLVAISPAFAYGAAFALFAGGGLLLALIRANTTPERQPGSRLSLIKEGLAYVWRTKLVLGAISLDLAAVLLAGATALLPVFARDVLHVGPEGFGVMRAAPAAGAAVMAIVLARWQVKRRAGLWMLAGVAVFGLCTLVFGLSQIFWLSVGALAVLGAADMISVYVRQTLIQIVTPDAMRGRVSAVSMLFISASNELGEFESGVAARFLGPVGAAVFGGVGAIAVTGLWAWMFPSLRKADRLV